MLKLLGGDFLVDREAMGPFFYLLVWMFNYIDRL
jgi:hypothetical protein